MKKLLSILGTVVLVGNAIPAVVGNSPYQPETITQNNNSKIPDFISDISSTLNLDSVYWIESQNNEILVHFIDENDPISYSIDMWNNIVNHIKNNSQYFIYKNNLLNIKYIISAGSNNEFFINKTIKENIMLNLGLGGYNSFIQHCSKFKPSNFMYSPASSAINLDYIYWIEYQESVTSVHFINEIGTDRFAANLWSQNIHKFKDNSQYFIDGNNLLNIKYIMWADHNNDFIMKKNSTDNITVNLGSNTYNNFVQHINLSLVSLNFVSNDTISINLNDICLIDYVSDYYLKIYFIKGYDIKLSINLDMWNNIVNYIKDKPLYFKYGNNIINLKYIVRVRNNNFTFNNYYTNNIFGVTIKGVFNTFYNHIKKSYKELSTFAIAIDDKMIVNFDYVFFTKEIALKDRTILYFTDGSDPVTLNYEYLGGPWSNFLNMLHSNQEYFFYRDNFNSRILNTKYIVRAYDNNNFIIKKDNTNNIIEKYEIDTYNRFIQYINEKQDLS